MFRVVPPFGTKKLFVPWAIVDELEQHSGGIRHVLRQIEGEFGLKLAYRPNAKHYVIIGPNMEILQLAIDTLKKRYLYAKERAKETKNYAEAESASGEQAQFEPSNNDEEAFNKKAFVGKLERRRAVWRFFGEYAKKVCHLFQPEMATLDSMKSVNILLSPTCVEIACSYDDADEVKQVVEELEQQVHRLFDLEIDIKPEEMGNVKQFLQKQDGWTVLCVFNEKEQIMKVYGRTEDVVKFTVDAWNREKHPPTPEPIDSPRSSIADIKHVPKAFKNELKLPGGLVRKLAKRRGGIQDIIDDMDKEFNLRIVHVPRRHCIIFGPNTAILDLAAQTIIHRYVLKTPSENGVVGQLQGQNVVWRFHGTYAKKANQLLKPEIMQLEKLKTVTVKVLPSKCNPTLIEILCSHKEIERVKMEVEKMVGDVHNLYEKHLAILNNKRELVIVREYVNQKYEEAKSVLCIFDESKCQLSVFSRTELLVHQTMAEIQDKLVPNPAKKDLPEALCNSCREIFQVKVADEILAKLEQLPHGATSAISRLEKEFGVKTVYHESQMLNLSSPSAELLELAHGALELRYVRKRAVRYRQIMKPETEAEQCDTDVTKSSDMNSSDHTVSNVNEDI